jgi:two-component system, OmpR family, response regulator CpxR
MSQDQRILIIEDDREAAAMMREYLAAASLRIEVASTGNQGLTLARQSQFELIILDRQLPDGEGLNVLTELRRSSAVPVLILSGSGEPSDRVEGLEAGADDYLSKPFLPRELLARVQAILRRTSDRVNAASQNAPIIERGDLRIDQDRQTATLNRKVLTLTATEYQLLTLLAASTPQPISRQQLSQRILGRPYLPTDRSIDNLISILRKKLGPIPDGPTAGMDRFISVRYVGYVYRPTGGKTGAA